MFTVGSSTFPEVFRYELGTPWDITSSIATQSRDFLSPTFVIASVMFHESGRKLYVCDSGNQQIYSYTLSTPWSLGSATYDNEFLDVTTEEFSP